MTIFPTTLPVLNGKKALFVRKFPQFIGVTALYTNWKHTTLPQHSILLKRKKKTHLLFLYRSFSPAHQNTIKYSIWSLTLSIGLHTFQLRPVITFDDAVRVLAATTVKQQGASEREGWVMERKTRTRRWRDGNKDKQTLLEERREETGSSLDV